MPEFEIKRPKAVLFDWDNTLIDSWRTSREALNETHKALGHPLLSEEDFRRRPQLSLKDAFPKSFGERCHEAEEIYYTHYEKIHLDRLTLLPGAADLLEILAKAGVYMAVVSNKNGTYLRRELEFLKWTGYFGAIVGSRDLESDKPSPLPVKFALEAGGHSANEDVLLVGDSAIDVECARNSGCTPVFVNARSPDNSWGSNLIWLQDCSEFARCLRWT